MNKCVMVPFVTFCFLTSSSYQNSLFTHLSFFLFTVHFDISTIELLLLIVFSIELCFSMNHICPLESIVRIFRLIFHCKAVTYTTCLTLRLGFSRSIREFNTTALPKAGDSRVALCNKLLLSF